MDISFRVIFSNLPSSGCGCGLLFIQQPDELGLSLARIGVSGVWLSRNMEASKLRCPVTKALLKLVCRWVHGLRSPSLLYTRVLESVRCIAPPDCFKSPGIGSTRRGRHILCLWKKPLGRAASVFGGRLSILCRIVGQQRTLFFGPRTGRHVILCLWSLDLLLPGIYFSLRGGIGSVSCAELVDCWASKGNIYKWKRFGQPNPGHFTHTNCPQCTTCTGLESCRHWSYQLLYRNCHVFRRVDV